MTRSRSRSHSISPSSRKSKTSRRRSSSRSKSTRRKDRYRSPDRTRSHKSSRHRARSQSHSDSSTNRYKSSSKKKSNHRRHRKRHSRSPAGHHDRRHRKSPSRSHIIDDSGSNSKSKYSSASQSSCSSNSTNDSRSPSPLQSSKLQKNMTKSPGANKIRLVRTPSPASITPTTMAFSSAMEYLDGRHVVDALDEINADEFVPKAFNSAGKTDANPEKLKVEARIKIDPMDDPIFHNFVYGDDDERMERWAKKVYTYRQKMFTTTN